MEALTVATAYGTALFEAARDRAKMEIVAEELEALDRIFREEPLFFELVCSPSIDASGKKASLDRVLRGKVSEELMNFLFILIDKRRIGQFRRIVRAYRKQMDDSMNVSAGMIYSVEPLSEDRLKQFETETGKLLRKSVKLENLLDPALVGGVRIFIEGKLIDASIRKQLDELKERLM
jgi:ATP synthase F1 delta subunit